MKIVIDAFGGDNSPGEIIKGCIRALDEEQCFSVVFCGCREKIEDQLSKYEYDYARVDILDAPEIISNEESPTHAIRSKPNSSIAAGLNYLADNDEACAFVSAGSTGAVLTGAVLLLKRIRGIKRPGLAPLLPTIDGGQVLLIDCGANTNPRPEQLCEFALMGDAYMKVAFGIEEPRIALLSNGAEDAKGHELNKQAFPLLKNMKLNFIGNLEARDMLSGRADVVVADGFSGNIAMKSAEGAVEAIFATMKQAILKGGLRAKLGYVLLRNALKEVKKRLDYNEKGGAVLLGLDKVVVKAHGASKAKSIKAAVLQAVDLVNKGITAKIKIGISEYEKI
jgi:glycerol-3-phosphate acyltransferase PlsX